jgi:putative ABC transport system substrate-binding protein
MGIVANLNRPGGNVTGVTFFNNVLGPKRLQVLHELALNAKFVGMLVNPKNPNTQFDLQDV